jgi:hypothetical protein
LENSSRSQTKQPINRILEKSFDRFFNYVAGFVGEKKALEFAEKSHQEIEKYFTNIVDIELGQGCKIKFIQNDLSDKEILGFSLWMRQFLKELKDFMIGLGKVDPEEITGDLKQELRSLGFFEYFEQAKELKY